ncbi:lipid phosphate phosphatase 2-like protein [Carex littledalei]|uniref:Lipid phosphate phosphatase 2-like protein n=1 Tax=Carex littledalei TaxID=544730 RepID=A0A833VHL2_9POAL|nr:lipid phosphate phosphatase 2-like protein [Carex littledalei]
MSDPASLTLRSHGARVARIHLYDWVILVALIVTDVLLNVIEPFHRFVGRDMMTDLRYPMKSNTVPIWAVPIYAVIGPMLIITGIYFKKRNVYDFHHAILGLLFSVLITAVLTDAIKDGVGRPRPDFFWRCFPDGIDKYDNVTLGVICHGEKSVIKEGHKSFPSGHTSWSFAGLGFFSWYLAGKLKAFDRKGHVGKLCLVIAPLLLAAMVAVSRVDDYWHHWQDVFTGGFLGLTVATICYLQFFPLPSDDSAFWPHAYHVEILTRNSNGDVQTGMIPIAVSNGAVQTGTNPFIVNTVEMEESTPYFSSDNGSPHDERDTNPILENMEAGRR